MEPNLHFKVPSLAVLFVVDGSKTEGKQGLALNLWYLDLVIRSTRNAQNSQR